MIRDGFYDYGESAYNTDMPYSGNLPPGVRDCDIDQLGYGDVETKEDEDDDQEN